MQSEQTGELAKALADAQLAIKAPTKGRTAKIVTKEKGTYSYKYADLSDVIECYREPLAKHGLALTQPMRLHDNFIILVTRLLHSSGQWISSEYPVSIFARPQEQGSALTYARRYAVCGLLGIAAEEDDDGAAAQEGTPKSKAEAKPPATAPALPRDDVEKIHTAAKKAGLKTTGELAPVLHNIVGVSKASDVPKGEVANVLEALEQMAERRTEATA